MIWEISTLIFAIAFLILVAFLVPALLQVRRSAQKWAEVAEDLDEHLPTILDNLDDISSNVSAITETGRYQVESLGGAVENIKGMVNDAMVMEQKIKRQLNNPWVKSFITVAATAKAARAFTKNLKRRRKS